MDVNNLSLTSNQAIAMPVSLKSVQQTGAVSSSGVSSSGETKKVSSESSQVVANKADTLEIDQQIAESREQLDKVMEQIKEKTKDMNFSVDMRYDDRINRTIAKIVDKETGNVIKEIPPEEMVKVAVMINELAEGILIDSQA